MRMRSATICHEPEFPQWAVAVKPFTRMIATALARTGLLLAAVWLVLLLLPGIAQSAQLDGIAARRSESGRVVYENAEPEVNLPAVTPPTAGASAPARPSAVEVDAAIEETAVRHGVDADLVRAVVKVESNYNPRAVSPKGAMGLMQLMPATARQFKLANPFDTRQNLDAGVRHLRSLLTNYNGDLRLSLAAYNAGAGAVSRANGVPPFAETQGYVRRITDLYGRSNGGWFPVPSIRVARDARGVLRITND